MLVFLLRARTGASRGGPGTAKEGAGRLAGGGDGSEAACHGRGRRNRRRGRGQLPPPHEHARERTGRRRRSTAAGDGRPGGARRGRQRDCRAAPCPGRVRGGWGEALRERRVEHGLGRAAMAGWIAPFAGAARGSPTAGTDAPDHTSLGKGLECLWVRGGGHGSGGAAVLSRAWQWWSPRVSFPLLIPGRARVKEWGGVASDCSGCPEGALYRGRGGEVGGGRCCHQWPPRSLLTSLATGRR